MRDSKALAAMLADDVGEVSDMDMDAEMPMDDEMPAEDPEMEEGQMAAVEEIMAAFEEKNPRAFLEALRSFVRLAI